MNDTDQQPNDQNGRKPDADTADNKDADALPLPLRGRSAKKTLIAVAVVVALGFFLIVTMMAGPPSRPGGKSVTKRNVEEGEFSVPDSKVVEFDNFRKTVSRQIEEVLGVTKEIAASNKARDAELKELHRQVSESNALGSVHGADDVADDLAKLPESLRAVFPAAVDEIERYVVASGNIATSDALPTFNPWVRSKVQTATDEQIEALAKVARVRRKPLTDDQYLAVSDIAARRAALGVPSDNIGAMVKLVWSRRGSLPPMTAGQMLSLAALAARTTVDGNGSGGLADGMGARTAKPSEQLSPWFRAATGQVDLPAMVAVGPLSATPDRVRVAIRTIIPLLVESTAGLKFSRDDGIRGAAYAIMLSDARVNLALAAGKNDPDAVSAALRAIEGDVLVGAKIALPFEVTSPNAQAIGIEQMVALRSSYLGALAAQTVLNARDGQLDMQVLSGVLKPPSEDVVGVAVRASNTKDQAHIYQLFDAVLRKSDGQQAYPLALQSVRTRVQALIPVLEESVAVVKAESPAQATPQRIADMRRLGLVAAALSFIAEGSGVDPQKQQAMALRSIARLAVYYGTLDAVEHEVRTVLVPRYAHNYLTLAIDWDALSDQICAQTHQTIVDAASGALIQNTSPADVANAINLIKRTALPLAEGAVNKAVVQQIVLGAIAEASIGRERMVVESVHEYMTSQIDRLVVPDYTDDRVRTIAGSIARDCIAILTGKRNLPHHRVGEPGAAQPRAPPVRADGNAANAAGVTGAVRSSEGWGTQDLRVIDVGPQQAQPAGTARPMAGPANRSQQAITLQSGSYGEAYLYTGAEAAATGTVQKRTVLINLSHSWKGTDSVIRMRNMKILGDAYPLAGATNRMLVDLKRISFRFPDGQLVERDCQGYVADNLEGRDGVVAEYRLNLGELGPLAAGIGAFSGLGTALDDLTRNNQSPTSSIVVNNNGTPPQAGGSVSPSIWAAGAASGAAAPISSYLTRAMAGISPTMVVPNGQPVSVVLIAPVVFDGVPKREWDSISGDPDTVSSLFP